MNEELVSIVVPIYNAEKYLEQCVDSILKQNYKNIELLLVDDGSTDSSSDLCEKYKTKDSRVKVIHKKNGGVSSARNEGIKNAKGEWITFVDADDFIDEDYVGYLHEQSLNNKADIALTAFPKKIKDNTVVNKEAKFDTEKVVSGVEAAITMLHYKIVISSWNKMFNNSFLKKEHILFNEKLSYGEGYDFVISAMLKSKRVFIGTKQIYNYRVDNADSAMTKFREKLVTGSIDAQFCIKKSIVDYCATNPNYEKVLDKAWNYSYWHTNLDCLNTIYGSNSHMQYKELTKKVSSVCRKKAHYALDSEIPRKDQIKAMICIISPRLCTALINKFRVRKFN